MDDFESIARRAALRRPDFFFLQIGANDGVRNDPLHRLIVEFRWPGILVEPQREMFERLRQNYRTHDNLTFLNAAVGDTPRKTLYCMQPGVENAPPWFTGIASFSLETVLKHEEFYPGIARHVISQNVECMSLADLVTRHRVDHVDLLQIDAEGYDYEIVKMVAPAGLHPSVIQFEHKHLADADRFACDQLLEKQGYRLFSKGVNTVAFQE